MEIENKLHIKEKQNLTFIIIIIRKLIIYIKQTFYIDIESNYKRLYMIDFICIGRKHHNKYFNILLNSLKNAFFIIAEKIFWAGDVFRVSLT